MRRVEQLRVYICILGCRTVALTQKQSYGVSVRRGYGSKWRISRLFAEMIMPRPPAAISRRKTLPLSVITPIDLIPRRFALLADTRALIKWESAHAFIRPVMCSIAVGAVAEKRELPPYPSFFFFLSYDPTKTRLHRTRGGAKSRGDTDSHGPSVSLCTQPLSIPFDLTSRTSHVNPSYPHSSSFFFFFFSVSNDLHKLSFHVFARVLSLTFVNASRD